MTKKFTEEQYKEIIRTYENNSGYDNKAMAVIRVVDNFNDSLSYNEAFALANPVTRELAHEQFVEEEKRYVWKTKALDHSDYPVANVLMMTRFKSVSSNSEEYADSVYMIHKEYHLTESEVKKWGYDVSRLDKFEIINVTKDEPDCEGTK